MFQICAKLLFKLNLCLALMILGTIILPSISYAQVKNSDDIFERFRKEMPKLDLLDNKKFTEETKPIKKKPYGDDSLAYSIRIPKDWTEREDKSSSNFILSEKLFLDLNVFYGNPTIMGRSRLEIEALNLEGNLTVEQWYLKYILEGGYAMEGFVVHNEDKVESLMVIMEKDYSFYLRTLVTINGTKIIMVKYYVPVAFIQEQAAMQEQVLSSFKLSNAKERQLIGLEAYRFLDVAEISYPETWRVFAKTMRNVDVMNASIVNVKQDDSGNIKNSSPDGKVDVTVVSSSIQSNLIEYVKEYKSNIEANGMLIGEKMKEDYNFTYDESMDFAITEVYKGIDSANNMSEYEFWSSILVGGNYYYFLMLLTPSRNENFSVWAENTQNYKIILKKFKPLAGAFLERD